MFFDRWSTKVQLPLGPKWGNNIGGVAACLNWSGGRDHKPSPPKKSSMSHKAGDKYRVTDSHYRNNYPHDFDTNNWSEDRYINIVPWKEDLGMGRNVDGNLTITGRSNDYHKDDLREDLLVSALQDVSRKQEYERSGLPPRPATGKKGTRGVMLRSATPKKGYGIMGPPPTPPRHAPMPSYRRTMTRPKNPSPEVYSTKYTERELIIEDLDDVNDGGRKSQTRIQSRSGSRAASASGHRHTHRYTTPRPGDSYRPHSGTGSHMPPQNHFISTYTPAYTPDNFSPTPLVWQSREFDKPVPHAKNTVNYSISPFSNYNVNNSNSNSNNNNNNNNNSNHRTGLSSRPKTASGNLSRDVRVNVGTMGHRAVTEDRVKVSDLQKPPATSRSSENITIHVDCSKLANSPRPASLTVRLHGVDTSDTGNIRINSIPAK